MKKSLFILICILAILLGGCVKRQNTPLGHGLELIDAMEVLIDGDEAMEVYNFSPEGYKSEIDALREIDFSKPKIVFKVTCDTRKLLEEQIGQEVSDEFFEIYANKSMASLVSGINSKEGTTSVILSSIFNVGKIFECKAIEEDMVYFYAYDGVIVAVCFYDGEDDACSATATVVLNKKLDASDASSFEDSLESLFNCDFEVKKVY